MSDSPEENPEKRPALLDLTRHTHYEDPIYENGEGRYVPNVGWVPHEIVLVSPPVQPASQAKVNELEQRITRLKEELQHKTYELNRTKKGLENLIQALFKVGNVSQDSSKGKEVTKQLAERVASLEGAVSVLKDLTILSKSLGQTFLGSDSNVHNPGKESQAKASQGKEKIIANCIEFSKHPITVEAAKAIIYLIISFLLLNSPLLSWVSSYNPIPSNIKAGITAVSKQAISQ